MLEKNESYLLVAALKLNIPNGDLAVVYFWSFHLFSAISLDPHPSSQYEESTFSFLIYHKQLKAYIFGKQNSWYVQECLKRSTHI